MDEKHALEQAQPLLDHYDVKRLDDLEESRPQPDPPVVAPKPNRPWWRRLIRIALTLFVLHLIFRGVRKFHQVRNFIHGTPIHGESGDQAGAFELPPSEFDEWVPGLAAVGDLDHPRAFWKQHQVIESMDADMVIDPNHTGAFDPLHFSLSTNPDKIGIFSRGPVAGNVTFDSNAKGDNVEITIEFFNHTAPEFDPFGKSCKGSRFPKGRWPFPRPPHPPPVPTVKIRQFINDKGEVQGLGLFAFVKHPRGHGPPPPPGGDHPPPPPPDGPPPPPPPHHHPHGPPPPPPPPHHPPHRDPEDDNELPSFTAIRKRGCKKNPEDRYRRWSLFSNLFSEPPKHPKHPKGPKGPKGRGPPGPLAGAKIHVSFPKSTDITFFGSELRLFKHVVGELSPAFGNLTFATQHGSIEVGGFTAQKAHVVSGHGGISGSFDVYDTLELKTTHSPIDVNVTLHNAPHDDKHNITSLKVANIHGVTNATISLVAEEGPEEAVLPPTYAVKASTISNSTDIVFASQPVNSTLYFWGESIAGNVTAIFAPAFDGYFAVNNILAPPLELVVDATVEDPAGEDRTRIVTRKDKFTGTTGSIHWVDKPTEVADEPDEPEEDPEKGHPSFIGFHGIKTKLALKF